MARHHRGGHRAHGRPLLGATDRATTTAPVAGSAHDVVLPDWLTAQLDLEDPALWAIVEAVEGMTALGHDASTPEGLQVCITAGRRRAEQLAAEWTPERVADQRAEAATAAMARADRLEATCSVYYGRLGQLVKIGYSSSPLRRMRELGCEDLLAVEPGGPAVETRRHDQFRALQSHGEWFRLEQPLIGHIAELRQHA